MSPAPLHPQEVFRLGEIQALIGEDPLRHLLASGIAPGRVVFWSVLDRCLLAEKPPLPPEAGPRLGTLLNRAGQKLTHSLASGILPGARDLLLLEEDGTCHVVSREGVLLRVPPEGYDLEGTTRGFSLRLDLHPTAPGRWNGLRLTLDLREPEEGRRRGFPLPLLRRFADRHAPGGGPLDPTPWTGFWTPVPPGTDPLPWKEPGLLWMRSTEEGTLLFREDRTLELEPRRTLVWRSFGEGTGVEAFLETPEGVTRLVAALSPEVLEAERLRREREDPADPDEAPSEAARRLVLPPERRAREEAWAAPLETRWLWPPEEEGRLLRVHRDRTCLCRLAQGEGPSSPTSAWALTLEGRPCLLVGRSALAEILPPGERGLEIPFPVPEEAPDLLDRPEGVPCALPLPDGSRTFGTLSLAEGSLTLRGFGTKDRSVPLDGVGFLRAELDPRITRAELRLAPGEAPETLLLPRPFLVTLWRRLASGAVAASLEGLTLGDLAKRHAAARRRAFQMGLFHPLLLAHRGLEADGSLQGFAESLYDHPQGPLPPEAAQRLIEKLTRMALERQRLSRHLDSQALLLPHLLERQEGTRLEGTFGDRLSPLRRCQEARGVFLRTRALLRQVQGNLAAPLGEIARNLQAVPFVFPEEIQCAAMGTFREDRGSLTSGAKRLTAFAGLSAQVLMEMERTHLGNLTDVALSGSIGVALVARLVQRNMEKKEEKVRLRAYGAQLLRWWQTLADYGALCLRETDRFWDEGDALSLRRDQEILESLPPEDREGALRRLAQSLRQGILEEEDAHLREFPGAEGLFTQDLLEDLERFRSRGETLTGRLRSGGLGLLEEGRGSL